MPGFVVAVAARLPAGRYGVLSGLTAHHIEGSSLLEAAKCCSQEREQHQQLRGRTARRCEVQYKGHLPTIPHPKPCTLVQISFSCVAYPCVLLQYFGQTAYIIAHPQDYQSAFWSSVPGPVFWPLLVIGTLAAIVASQVSLNRNPRPLIMTPKP